MGKRKGGEGAQKGGQTAEGAQQLLDFPLRFPQNGVPARGDYLFTIHFYGQKHRRLGARGTKGTKGGSMAGLEGEVGGTRGRSRGD